MRKKPLQVTTLPFARTITTLKMQETDLSVDGLKRRRHAKPDSLQPIESTRSTFPTAPGLETALALKMTAMKVVAQVRPEAAAVLRGVHPVLRGDPKVRDAALYGQEQARLYALMPLVSLHPPHVQPEYDWLVCPILHIAVREGIIAARTASVSMFKYLRFYPEDPWGFFT